MATNRIATPKQTILLRFGLRLIKDEHYPVLSSELTGKDSRITIKYDDVVSVQLLAKDCVISSVVV